jgi:DNA-binding transcriptional MerR regulator
MARGDDEKLYKIGEVCRLADVQPYVLRFWETEFPQLAPNKSGGGQRLYTKREIDIILRIKQLLYTEGFTIAGAKRQLEGELNAPAETAKPKESAGAPSPPDDATREKIATAVEELRSILKILE